MTKKDFIDWKQHPITKEVFAILREKIYGMQIELGMSAGVDPRLDAMKVGAIQACNDVLDLEWEDDK